MAQAINVPVNVQTQNTRQLTQELQTALNRVRLNFGNGKALSSLSQPLGRLTGQADEFTKSLDAANARVLAFGASVGIVNAFSNAFKSLVNSTIEVEKAIKAITVVGDQFNGKTEQLTKGLFNVAKTTGQSFAEVSKAALEFSRQGKGVEETLQRTQDALILTRLTGLDAAKAVEGLTAAANGFSKAGLSTTQILNKLAAVDQAFAVSSADLIEGFNRSAAVAQNAGVTFDELTGIITALQQETSRGGAVIGNALKTIFTRLQDTSTLNKLQGLGIAVKDLQNNILPARQILQNLANDVEGLGEITKAGIFKDVAGTFQINQLISLVSDLNKENSIAAKATEQAANATNEAFVANQKLNQALDAIINKVALTGKELGSLIGNLGLADNFKGILDGINGFLEGAAELLQGDDLGSRFAKGIVKGIGAVLTGPGLGIFLAIIGKLTVDLVKFGTQSLKTFFNIGRAAKEQQQVQESIVQTLLRNENVLRSILNTQGGQNAQAKAFLTILNQQEQALQNIRSLAGGLAAPIIAGGYGVGPQGGIQRRGRAAGGYLPAQEASDVRRGVGGAPPNSKVVAIPNFAFGGGKRGTMIANTSEYIVPNYAGGGSAIFNQDMVKTMGLPAGAKKIGAVSGYVPNFANFNVQTGKKRKEKDANIIDYIKIGGMSPSAYLTLGSGARTNAGKFRDLQPTAQEILQQRLGPISQSAEIEGSGIEFINLNRLQSTYLSGGELVSDITDLRLNINSGQVNKSDLGQRLRNIANKILPQTPGKLDDGLRKQLESEIFSTSQAKFSAGNIFEQVLVKTVSGQLAEKNSKTWDLPKNISAAFKKRFGISSEFGDIKLGISPSSVSSFIGKHIINPTGDNKSSASNGYIPNFAFTNDQLGVLGLYGPNTPINGSQVYTFESNRPQFFKDIKSVYQKRVTGIVNSYARQIAGKIGNGFQISPKAVVKSLDSTDRISGFIFEDVMNQLAGPNFDTNRVSGNVRIDFPMTSNLREVFGVTGGERFAEVKLTPQEQVESILEKQKALAKAINTGGYTPKETDSKLIEELRKEAIEVEFGKGGRPKIELRDRKKAFIQKMRSSGLLTQAYLGPGADESAAIKRALGLASGGYIPNFASSDFNGNGRVDPSDGIFARLRNTAKKYAPTAAPIIEQVLQNLLGLPEGVEVMKTVEACVQAMTVLKEEDKINEKLRKIASEKRQAKRREFLSGRSSSGFIPSFAASALQQAIAREKSAGLSSSQIYVDQSSALKSPSNPMGLMVANTRDEPGGGFQGIVRARREGANPKLYGAANGFVPNYAVQAPIGKVSAIKGILAQDKVDDFNKALEAVAKQLKNNQISLSKAEQDIEDFAKAVGTSKKGQDILTSEGKKLIQAYDSESKTRKQKAEELRKQRSERTASSEASQSPKGVGDSLAKVVGLQSAVLGLQTVIESMADEGSDFAKASQTIGGVIAAIGSGATLFTAGLGPLGIALGAVVVGFNLLKDVFPTTLQSIKESFGGLSLEGQKASKALDEFAEKISRGGVSVEEAFKTAEQQAAEASLRAKAKGAGIKTETETGAQKDPVKLARELVIENTRRNQSLMGIGLDTDIYKEVGSELSPSLGTNFGAPQQKVRYSIFGQAEALFSDFNESTQNVIFDILEESVSVNKTGLVALGKKIKKENPRFEAKDFKDLSSDKDILDYRAQLLSAIIGGKDVKEILQKAIKSEGVIGEGGKFDQNKFQQALRESGLANIPVKLLKDLGKAAQDVENATQTNVFRKNLDDLILQYNNFSTQINRGVTSATNLLEGLTGSSTFSALSEQRQFQLKSGLDRFKSNTSFAKSQRDLTEQARTFINNQAKNIENISGKPELEQRLRSFVESGTIDNLEETLKYLSENSSLSGDKLFELQKETSNLINANRDLNSNREVENALLEFSIQERQNELSAMKTFYDGIESFTKGIRGQEARLRQIDFELKKVQQDASFQKELLNIQAPTLDAFRSGTVDIENTALNKETNLRLEQAKIQADIELKRNLYTLENITALNRNTEALEANLKLFQEQSLNDKITRLEKDIIYTKQQGGSNADISEVQAQLNIAKSSLQALSSATLPTSDMGLKMRELINASSEEARRAILDSIPNQSQRENLRKLYEENAASLKAQIDNINKDVKIQKGNIENQQKINSALDSYESALNTTARGLKQSLLSDPKSLGQFAAGQRTFRIAQEEQRRRQTGGDAAVREYRSSFGRGFEEALGPIEEKTLDFKNELGREIPQLFSQNLAQGLNDAISGAKSLKDALTDAATSFLNAITQKNLENLANLFTVGAGSTVKSFFASGGQVNGGSGTKDDVPAMLMGGEYVIKKSAVKKYGSKFLDSLNNGGIKAFAAGGGVQSGRGGFYVPGDYGEGAITGKNQLLAFAGQSFTGGQYDQIGVSGMGGASVNLESESARLTAFGRENSPMFERVQQAKEEAFNVYLNQLKQEQQYREQKKQIAEAEKARKKQLTTAIISAVASSALSYAGSAFSSGASNAVGSATAQAAQQGTTLGTLSKIGIGLKGGLGFGGMTGKGGLGNLFSGNFSSAFTNFSAMGKAAGAKPNYNFNSSGQYRGTTIGNATYLAPNYLRGAKMSGGATPFPNVFTYGDYDFNRSTGSYQRRAFGGMISGGSGIRDDVPAMLTGGEFVLNNRATRKLGVENLNRLNSGDVGGSSGNSGQQVSEAIISKLDELIQTTRESSKDNVVVNVSGMEGGEKRSDENKSVADRELQRKIRDAVLAVLAQEKRLGGSLNK